MVIKGTRNEYVIYFNGDNTAKRIIQKGKNSKVVDEAYLKEDVVNVIHRAVIKGQLKRATKIVDDKMVTYSFLFDGYDKRKDERKVSAVKIIVPIKFYDKDDSYILALDAITKTNIRMRINRFRWKLALAAIVFVLGLPAAQQWEEEAEERYRIQMEAQEEQVEKLTGKRIDEIVGKTDEEKIEEAKRKYKENNNNTLDENENMVQDAISFGK